MGISRDSLHKKRATGGKKKVWRKKRKYELGRQPAMTKLSSNKTVRRVRVRGGNVKWRALRLDTGNYSWGSEAVTRKSRILDVVYNASNNELVRTQTLVRSAIIQVDAAPFRQWYERHYGQDIGRKKKAAAAAPKKETTEIAQTPLHVAAAHNKKEIVKFLLNWQGPEKLELEAKNMYGETPLHMAAKNGCTEVLRLLLEHNADIEARANNGMTPLHLAVWHSLRAEDCSTVEALLQYHADINAKDNDGMTPLSHLSQGPSNQKLHSLLQVHLDEQRKRKAKEACEKSKSKMSELEVELSKVVGLHELKVQLRTWAKGMILDEKRRALGLKVAARRSPHMAFLGNPGTGKTMVARILGKLLHMVGVLPTDKVTEVQRTDLVGEFVGHTGPKTRKKIKEAEGGILFVDEAYRLIPMQKADDKDYDLEALEEIMSIMDSGKVVVIFAGYAEPMKRVIGSNEGFCRRVTRYFFFDDFSPRELAEIVQLKINEQVENSLLYGFKLHETCSVEAIADLIVVPESVWDNLWGLVQFPVKVSARLTHHFASVPDHLCC